MSVFDKFVASVLPLAPPFLVYRVARRYVAGEDLAAAVEAVRLLESEGAMATVDVLGEDVADATATRKAVDEYKQVLDAIVAGSLDANISIKPTMFGLKLDKDLCLENLVDLVRYAKEKSIFLRLDMEDSTCTDDTFWLTRELRKEWEEVGVVIQACLRRTLADLDHLIADATNVRVCKGIYIEPRELAWQDRQVVVRNYGLLVNRLLEAGNYVGIATHDEECVWDALRAISRLGLAPEAYEFQMLLGVQPALRRILLGSGHRLRGYVPFGSSWYAYSIRRLKENPAIVGHVVRALLSRAD